MIFVTSFTSKIISIGAKFHKASNMIDLFIEISSHLIQQVNQLKWKEPNKNVVMPRGVCCCNSWPQWEGERWGGWGDKGRGCRKNPFAFLENFSELAASIYPNKPNQNLFRRNSLFICTKAFTIWRKKETPQWGFTPCLFVFLYFSHKEESHCLGILGLLRWSLAPLQVKSSVGSADKNIITCSSVSANSCTLKADVQQKFHSTANE